MYKAIHRIEADAAVVERLNPQRGLSDNLRGEAVHVRRFAVQVLTGLRAAYALIVELTSATRVYVQRPAKVSP